MAEDWTEFEIDLIVADYLAMLGDELAQRPFNKAERNRALQHQIPRSRGSIEFKHQNISAVMLGLGQPWIEGYKPAANFQKVLVDGVLRQLELNSPWLASTRYSSANAVREAPALWVGPRQLSVTSRLRLIPSSLQPSVDNMTSPNVMLGIGHWERLVKN